MRLGFFGGCFNPPTNAHLYIAKEAIHKCNLDKVIFVPMGDCYEKLGLIKAKDRYNMLKIVCECSDTQKIEVSDLEINIDKKLSTIEAFKLIEEKYKGSNNFFLMGADNFVKILKWEKSKELITKYNYIVFEREEIDIEKFIKENEILKSHSTQINIIKNNKYKKNSSSEFRKEKNKDIIPKEVLDYIEKNNIY